MITKKIMLLVLFIWVAGCTNKSSDIRIPAEGKNVVLIIIDTLRADHLSCYGYPRNTSPAIDSLAASGTRWIQAQSQAPWTLPSHASIWTGLSVKSHGTTHVGGIDGFDLALNADLPSLPQLLKDAGYQTSGFVNFVLLSEEYGFDRGFDWYDCNNNGERTISNTIDSFLCWIDNSADDKNFFTVLHLYDVHAPYSPVAPFDTVYCTEGNNGVIKWDKSDTGELMNPDDLQHLTDMYDSEILYVDSELSRLFSELRSRSLTDNTLFIVTSDHGEEFLEHGGVGHGHSLYNEQILIPLIFSGPGIESNQISPVHAALYDLMPTILSYLDVDIPGRIEGVDLLSITAELLRSIPSGGVSPDKFFLFQQPLSEFQSCAVIEGSNKIIAYMGRDEFIQFNLEEDPGELSPFDADSNMTDKALFYWATPLIGNPPPIGELSDENLRILNDLGYVN